MYIGVVGVCRELFLRARLLLPGPLARVVKVQPSASRSGRLDDISARFHTFLGSL